MVFDFALNVYYKAEVLPFPLPRALYGYGFMSRVEYKILSFHRIGCWAPVELDAEFSVLIQNLLDQIFIDISCDDIGILQTIRDM